MRTVSINADGDGTLEVVLRGEVDFTNSSAVLEHIDTAVRHRQPQLIRIQMAEVAFLDSSGIGVLVSIMRTAEQSGAGFRVVQPTAKVFDQLDLSGLLDAFGLTAGDRPAGE